MKQYYNYFLFGIFLLSNLSLSAKEAVFVASSNAIARHNLTEKAYVDMYMDLKRKGYRLKQLDGYAVSGKLRYAAIWRKQSGADLATFHKMSSNEFTTKANDYAARGFKMTWISGFQVNGQDFYAAIWVKKSGPKQAIRHRMDNNKYGEEYFKWKKKGFRLVKISAYARGGKAQFAAIWEQRSGPDLKTHHILSSSDYQDKVETYARQGFFLSHLNAYTVNNKDYYAAIWEKRASKGVSARHRLSATNYPIEFENHFYSGYNLKMVSGYQRNGKAQYAAIWEANKIHGRDLAKINQHIDRFMRKYNVPGLQIAIGKDERLLYARGFGKADRRKNINMGPDHKARIASISKTLTAAGIMRLAEKRSDFNINQEVFGNGSLLGKTYANGNYSVFQKQIQVKHLLEHTAGGNNWDNNTYQDHRGDNFDEKPKTGDPMLTNDNRSQDQLINDFLNNGSRSKLEMAPGRYFAYSNFGYILLGKIIAKKSGRSYRSWMKTNILDPAGARGMYISKTALKDKRPNEVVYYGNSSSDDPYSKYNIERMAAHGGWAASVLDLSKINVRIDGKPRKRDLISRSSFNSMLKQDSYTNIHSIVNRGNYAKGWTVWDSGSFMHGGSLPGTRSRLKNVSTGFFYAIIINSNPRTDAFREDFDKLGDQVIKLLDQWPNHDFLQ